MVKSTFGAALVCLVVALSPLYGDIYSDAILADNPLGYWRLNETSGSVAFDSSLNGRDGTYVGGVVYGEPGALLTSADTSVRFNGNNTGVDLPGSWGGSAMTVEAWVNVSGSTGSPFQAIVSSRGLQWAHLQLWEQGSPGGTGGIAWYTDTGPITIDAPDIEPFNEWRYIAWVAEAGSPGTAELYINGYPVGSVTESFDSILSTGDAWIGQGIAGRYFLGRIDEVAIYGEALTAGQIESHYLAAPEPSGCLLSFIGLLALAGTRSARVAEPLCGQLVKRGLAFSHRRT